MSASKTRKIAGLMFYGLQQYRWNDNPEEKRFAVAWAQSCEQGKTLDYLLDTTGQNMAKPADAIEHAVAATLIQWLGSPVGQLFLRELGYKLDVEDDNAPMTGSFPTVTQKTEKELRAAGFHPTLSWRRGLGETRYTTSEAKRYITSRQKKAERPKTVKKKPNRLPPSGGGTCGNAANPHPFRKKEK